MYMFAEDPETGRVTEVAIDPAHRDRQVRDLRAAGLSVSILDEDERIRFGILSQNLTAAHRASTAADAAADEDVA